MNIFELNINSATLTLSSANLYTLANANMYLTADPSRDPISAIVAYAAQGQTIFPAAANYAGTSVPVVNVQPAYYPKAIKGAECAAHVSTLDWANENLNQGYQWCKTGAGYFVAGVLNSTQTDANDPFASTDILTNQVACWKEEYGISINPF